MELPAKSVDTDDNSKKFVEDEDTNRIQRYFTLLVENFPDADVGFIWVKSREYTDDAGFNVLLDQMLANDYPKKEKIIQVPYSTDPLFDGFKFIKKYKDPMKYFSQHWDGESYKEHSLQFLMERYSYIRISVIRAALEKNEYRLYSTDMELRHAPFTRKIPRRIHEMPKILGKPPKLFSDEVDLICYEAEVKKYMLMRNKAVEKARKENRLITCRVCYESDVLPNEVVYCSEGHASCENCVHESTYIKLGEGRTVFPCLQECTGSFSLNSLKDIIPEYLFNIISKKIQAEEVASANIPGLETCPSCSYSAIPPESSKIFYCDNCDTQTCRLCHRKAHIPFKCDEMKDKDTEQRVFVEEAMTEALLRKCLECGKQYVRGDGCNFMTCTCKATMCYVCRKPVNEYGHFFFNFNMGDRASDGSCLLWSNDKDVHHQPVRKAREQAINTLKRKNPGLNMTLFAKKKK